MKSANNFFGKYKQTLVGELYTCLIGQIERFDPVRMSADVVLLPDGDLVIDLPVGIQQTSDFFIRMPYAVGDMVLVVFSQRDIDGIVNSGDATPSRRMLDKNDGVVICGINPFDGDPLPAADGLDLVIGKRNGNAKIVMKEATDAIEITCSTFKVNGAVVG